MEMYTNIQELKLYEQKEILILAKDWIKPLTDQSYVFPLTPDTELVKLKIQQNFEINYYSNVYAGLLALIDQIDTNPKSIEELIYKFIIKFVEVNIENIVEYGNRNKIITT